VDLATEVGLLATSARGPAVSLTMRVENAFDARYQGAFGYDAPGRVVLVGARLVTGR
jgi:outer membrane cobalamin receptor